MPGVVMEREYTIHYYEIDYRKRALITSLMNYFEDIAILQSEKQGVGMDYLKEKSIAWVLYKWDIKIHKHPTYGDRLRVRTYPYSFFKFYAYRKFEILDENGAAMVSANSMWLLVNTKTRKPVKIPDEIYAAYSLSKDDSSPLDFQDIEALTGEEHVKTFYVRYSDIDTNRHVNNVKYVDWAIESMPQDLVLNYALKRIAVTYKKETTYGESIQSRTVTNIDSGKAHCFHSILDTSGKELCILKTQWTLEG